MSSHLGKPWPISKLLGSVRSTPLELALSQRKTLKSNWTVSAWQPLGMLLWDLSSYFMCLSLTWQFLGCRQMSHHQSSSKWVTPGLGRSAFHFSFCLSASWPLWSWTHFFRWSVWSSWCYHPAAFNSRPNGHHDGSEFYVFNAKGFLSQLLASFQSPTLKPSPGLITSTSCSRRTWCIYPGIWMH